jgi:cyclase
MLKKRLILTLLIQHPFFMNSRNFRLQPMVNLETMVQHLNLKAIDELVVLDVSRGNKSIDMLCQNVKSISKKCFVPISAGGGVKSLYDFQKLLNSGADKIIINTVATDTPEFITKASETFGSQCVVVSIDTKKWKDGEYYVYSNNGQVNIGRKVLDWAKEVETLGAGEIYLTSIDRDGTAQGYDLDLIRKVSDAITIPVIASGGVGEFNHLADGVKAGASAVSLANLFHYIGTNLINAKTSMSESGVDCPLWNF